MALLTLRKLMHLLYLQGCLARVLHPDQAFQQDYKVVDEVDKSDDANNIKYVDELNNNNEVHDSGKEIDYFGNTHHSDENLVETSYSSQSYWNKFFIILSMEERLVTHVANILSTMTILSCLFLKVPQIMYVRNKQSADGIYIQAMMMEVAGFSVMCLYNFTNEYCLMTYLEYPIILMQVHVLIYYVLKYKRQLDLPIVPMATVAYVVVVGCFVMGVLPKNILSYLVPFCTPLSGFAKLTYVYGIVTTSNAEAVSISTWVISVITNMARVFTVYVDSRDLKLMANFLISALLSATVLFTALFYQLFRTPTPLQAATPSPQPSPPPTPPPQPRRRCCNWHHN